MSISTFREAPSESHAGEASCILRPWWGLSRTGYIICKTQCKMKMQIPVFKKYVEFEDGDSRVFSQAEALLSRGPVLTAQVACIESEGGSRKGSHSKPQRERTQAKAGGQAALKLQAAKVKGKTAKSGGGGSAKERP